MRLVVQKICAIAYDKRVSDKRFREAIQRLTSPEISARGSTKVIDFLHEDAIVETERDMLGMGRDYAWKADFPK